MRMGVVAASALSSQCGEMKGCLQWVVAGKRNSHVSYYQTVSRLQSGGTWRQVAPTLTLIKIFSITTNTKEDFRTAAERQWDAATGVLELVCSRRQSHGGDHWSWCHDAS